jgi:hypothetical protein
MTLYQDISAELRLLREIVRDLEWSGERQGPGTSMGSQDGAWYPACPICGGLEEHGVGLSSDAVGHRSGCRMAQALGRPTTIRDGETGRLTL